MEKALSPGLSAARLLVAAVGTATLAVGCSQPAADIGRTGNVTEDVRAINRDPVGFLRELAARCDRLDRYRLKFHRQERLGLIPTIGAMEEINAAFRSKPFSVKFEWPDEKMPYYESVYVEGRNDNKLIIRERHGLLFAPPQVRVVNVDLPVKIGKAKNPITVFGLANLARRTLAPFEDERLRKVMTIKCNGVVDLEPMHRSAYYLVIERPPTEGYRYTRQDVFVDVETGLPAGTDLWLEDGQLDARYRYSDVQTNVTLTDADFHIRRPSPAGDTKDRKAGQATSKESAGSPQ
ncbi:MAG TPA: DUF1571 domain-containing protein [Phycisphaerae bacterium]|nr:DUF1571 domain-containing protein [Phycisphaerae bacterium]